MTVVHVNLVVKLMPIVQHRRSASMKNVNAVVALLAHRSVVLILMNVPMVLVTAVLVVIIFPDLSVVRALTKQSVIHMQHPVVLCQINVLATQTVLRIWNALLENVLTLVRQENVAKMQFVKHLIMVLYVVVQLEILEIQLTKLLVASELNVLPVKIAQLTNNATQPLTNVIVSISLFIKYCT